MKSTRPSYQELIEKVAQLDSELARTETALRNTEQRLLAAEQQAEEREEKYRTLYTNAPLSYQFLDENGCFLDVNPMWLNTLGYEKNEVIGKWFGDFLHPDYVEHFKKSFPVFKKRGYVSDIEFRLRRKDNSFICVSFEGCIAYTPEGDFKQTYCVFKDITRQKNAERKIIEQNQEYEAQNEEYLTLNEELRQTNDELNKANKKIEENEERFNLAMNATRDGIYDWNLVTNEIYYSPQWKKMLGYEDEDLPNDFSIWEKLTKPEDVKKSWEMQKELINKQRDRFEMEFQMKHKNGGWVDILSRAEAVFNETGKAVRIVGTHFDITEQKKTLNLLKDRQARLTLALESAGEGMWEWNMKENKVFFDQGAMQMLGYTKEDYNTSAEFALNLIHPDHKEEILKISNEYLAGKREKYNVEFPIRRKDGSYLWVWSVGRIILRDKEGRPEKFIGIHRDISERKQAEEALRESEKRFSTIFRFSPAPLVLSEIDTGLFLDVNERWVDMLEFGREEQIGKTSKEVGIWNDPGERDRLVDILHSKGRFRDEFIKFNTKSGKTILALWSAEMVTLSGKQVMLSMITDITERRKAEEDLRKSESRYRRAQEIGNVGNWEFNLESGQFWGSEQGKRIYGFDPEADEFTAEEVYKCVVEPKRVEQAMVDLLEENKNYDIEFEITPKDGSKNKWIRSIAETERDKNGKPVKVVGVMQNITDRKKAEEKIKESEARFKGIFQNSNIGIAVAKPNGLISDVNYEFENMLGYSKAELLNMTFRDFTHPDDINKENELIGKLLQGEIDSYRIETRYFHKKGNIIWVDLSIAVMKDDKGNFVLFIGMIKDITARKKAESELIEAKEKAEESDRLKSAFLANMSHEIRTPMNGILGFADLLADPVLSAEKRDQYAEIIKTSGDRLMQTINDIIDISRIEACETKIETEETNIGKLINEVFNFMLPLAKKKNLLLRLVSGLSDNEYNQTDKNKLHSILTNLVNNAIKFTEYGEITMGCHVIDNHYKFFIKDTGIGIPAEKHQSIFNRFEQADQKLNRGYEGSGLGLSITKAYVEMLGGRIWVESESGKGSCFYFTLPVKTKPGTSAIQGKAMKPETSRANKLANVSILIVDDEETAREYLVAILGKECKDVFVAKDGVEAIEIYRKNRNSIDIILMDIKMRGLDGFEATKDLLQLNPAVRVFAQTAYAIAVDKEKCLREGFVDYIAKPIKKEDLFKILAKWV